MPALQLAPDHNITFRVDAMDLKTDFAMSRPIVVTACMVQSSESGRPTATMAPKCRWRSRPQHQKRTSTVSADLAPPDAGSSFSDCFHHGGISCQRIGTASSPLSPGMTTSIGSVANIVRRLREPVEPLKLFPCVGLREAGRTAPSTRFGALRSMCANLTFIE